MSRVYLGLGTNLGNKAQNMQQAIDLLIERVGELVARSSPVVSKPWGFESENEFLNAVICMRTDLAPIDLLRCTQQIEKELGRKSKSNGTYADRLIDIDILLYDNLIVDEEELKIPHPFILERDFVLLPLIEIAPNLVNPLTGNTFG